MIFGRLEQRSYDDKEGNKRSIVEIVAEEVAIATKSLETITRRQRQAGDDAGGSPQPAQRRPQATPAAQQNQQRRSRPMTVKTGASNASSAEIPEDSEPF